MEKALELDPLLPEAHLSLAAYTLVSERNWRGAEKEIKRVIGSTSDFAEIHHLHSFYLVTVRRFDEAVEASRRALECDPLSISCSRFLGLYLYFARRYDEAISQYQEALELDPNNAVVHESLGDAYATTGNLGEAVAEWQSAMRLAGDHEFAAILGSAWTEAGFAGAVTAVARTKLQRMDQAEHRDEYVPAIERARAYVRLGNREQALRWLEAACDERNAFSLLVNADPFYDGLRSDSRFDRLVERVGRPARASVAGL